MKLSPIIPLHKMEYANSPFRLQTIQSLMEERDEKKEDPHYHNFFELIWETKMRPYLRSPYPIIYTLVLQIFRYLLRGELIFIGKTQMFDMLLRTLQAVFFIFDISKY